MTGRHLFGNAHSPDVRAAKLDFGLSVWKLSPRVPQVLSTQASNELLNEKVLSLS